MACYNSPKVSTNGLVFCMDVANKNSYPGSGGIWYDIVAKDNGSILNLTGDTTQFFTFSGASNSYVIFTEQTLASNNFTIAFWCRPNATTTIVTEANTGITGTSGQRYVFGPTPTATSSGGVGVSVGTNGILSFEHKSAHLPAPLVWSGTVSSTVFTNVVMTYVNKQPILYVNGVLTRTGLSSVLANVILSPNTFGNISTNYGAYSGDLSTMHLYNRVLTNDEILRNYNALKGRFGNI